MKLKTLLAAAAASVLVLAGCTSTAATPGDTSSGGTKLNVVVAFYPLAYVTQTLAGDAATVTNLTTPGTEPHELTLTPRQIATLGEADLVVYQKGFQSTVDAAVAQATPKKVIDVASVVKLQPLDDDHHADDGHDHSAGSLDPHFWLDPANMVTLGDAVTKELAALAPARASVFEANKTKLTTDLNTITQQYTQGLASCKRSDIIVSHEAFGYLARAFKLHQIGISGISPDAEPSPARIAEVHALAKKYGVTTIFFETLSSPAVAKSIAGDLGLKTDVLDPIEGITAESRGTNYVEVMASNLAALKKANDCT